MGGVFLFYLLRKAIVGVFRGLRAAFSVTLGVTFLSSRNFAVCGQRVVLLLFLVTLMLGRSVSPLRWQVSFGPPQKKPKTLHSKRGSGSVGGNLYFLFADFDTHGFQKGYHRFVKIRDKCNYGLHLPDTPLILPLSPWRLNTLRVFVRRKCYVCKNAVCE